MMANDTPGGFDEGSEMIFNPSYGFGNDIKARSGFGSKGSI
jgi:hypothetical protein